MSWKTAPCLPLPIASKASRNQSQCVKRKPELHRLDRRYCLPYNRNLLVMECSLTLASKSLRSSLFRPPGMRRVHHSQFLLHLTLMSCPSSAWDLNFSLIRKISANYLASLWLSKIMGETIAPNCAPPPSSTQPGITSKLLSRYWLIANLQ